MLLVEAAAECCKHRASAWTNGPGCCFLICHQDWLFLMRSDLQMEHEAGTSALGTGEVDRGKLVLIGERRRGKRTVADCGTETASTLASASSANARVIDCSVLSPELSTFAISKWNSSSKRPPRAVRLRALARARSTSSTDMPFGVSSRSPSRTGSPTAWTR